MRGSLLWAIFYSAEDKEWKRRSCGQCFGGPPAPLRGQGLNLGRTDGLGQGTHLTWGALFLTPFFLNILKFDMWLGTWGLLCRLLRR